MGVLVLALKRLEKKCFEGDVMMPKVNFWMIGTICTLTGVVFGLLAAPLTHGVIIGSNSGNISDSNNGSQAEGKRRQKSHKGK